MLDILKIKKGITSIIGSGGKTTLMYALADELSKTGKVIVCTSTKIFVPEHIITLEVPYGEDFCRNPVCIGTFQKDGKLSAPKTDLFRLAELADYVLCEADGAKGLPLKAHLEYEPVIHRKSVDILGVLGIKGVGGRIADVCHRPERYAEMLKVSVFDRVEPEMAAMVIKEENLCTSLIINQVENYEKLKMAEKIADCLDIPVYAGEVGKGNLICLHS